MLSYDEGAKLEKELHKEFGRELSYAESFRYARDQVPAVNFESNREYIAHLDLINNKDPYKNITSKELNISKDNRKEIEELIGETFSVENYSQAKINSDIIAEKLEKIGQEKQAEKVGDCYSSGIFEIYSNGNIDWKPISTCNYTKLCPFHSRQESKRRLEKYLPVLRNAVFEKDLNLYFGTLTVKNYNQGELKRGYDELWGYFKEFMKTDLMSSKEKGYIANIETTYNLSDDSFNLHIHLLLGVEKTTYFNFNEIRDEWLKVTNNNSKWIWFSKPIKYNKKTDSKYHIETEIVKQLKEVVKYTAKFTKSKGKNENIKSGGLVEMPLKAFKEWFKVFNGRRTLRTYSDFYNCGVEPEDQEDQEGQDQDQEKELIGKAVFQWDKEKQRVQVVLVNIYSIQGNKFRTRNKIKEILQEKVLSNIQKNKYI